LEDFEIYSNQIDESEEGLQLEYITQSGPNDNWVYCNEINADEYGVLQNNNSAGSFVFGDDEDYPNLVQIPDDEGNVYHVGSTSSGLLNFEDNAWTIVDGGLQDAWQDISGTGADTDPWITSWTDWSTSTSCNRADIPAE
jgi:hypothetical protein